VASTTWPSTHRARWSSPESYGASSVPACAAPRSITSCPRRSTSTTPTASPWRSPWKPHSGCANSWSTTTPSKPCEPTAGSKADAIPSMSRPCSRLSRAWTTRNSSHQAPASVTSTSTSPTCWRPTSSTARSDSPKHSGHPNSASETSEPAGPSTTASRSTPGRAEAHPSHLEEPPECAISRSTSRPLSDSTTCSANSLTTYSSRTRATYWRTPQETASDSPTNRPTTNPVIDEVIVSGTDHRGDGHLELF